MYHYLLFLALLLGLAVAGAPAICLVEVFALFGALLAVAFFSHRRILKRMLEERGFTLARFKYAGGFSDWGTNSAWCEWRVT